MLIAQEEAAPADKRELVIPIGKLRKKSLLSGQCKNQDLRLS